MWDVWRQILDLKKFKYETEIPYGLEVIDADVIERSKSEFWIDCWYLYHIDISPVDLENYVKRLFKNNAIKNLNPGDYTLMKAEQSWEKAAFAEELRIKGLIGTELYFPETPNIKIEAAYVNKILNYFNLDKTFFQVATSLDVTNQSMMKEYSFLSTEGPTLINCGFLSLMDYLDSINKLPKYCKEFKNLPTSVDFQYDQVNKLVPQTINIKKLLQNRGIV
jgi:hypothetical protein